MKKTLGITLFALLIAVALAGCAQKKASPAVTAAPAATRVPMPEPVPEPPKPLVGSQLRDGVYPITVTSSSSMFRIVSAQLTVKDGGMTAVLTMSGQGYGKLYMGTGNQALADAESSYIPFVLDANGAKTFHVPVAALNQDIDCAAWSIRKESWYDRVLVFQSEWIPADAILTE